MENSFSSAAEIYSLNCVGKGLWWKSFLTYNNSFKIKLSEIWFWSKKNKI